MFREGDHVKAVVTDVNTETKKISLALKRSMFPDGAVASDEGENDEFGSEEDDVEDVEDGVGGSEDDDMSSLHGDEADQTFDLEDDAADSDDDAADSDDDAADSDDDEDSEAAADMASQCYCK